MNTKKEFKKNITRILILSMFISGGYIFAEDHNENDSDDYSYEREKDSEEHETEDGEYTKKTFYETENREKNTLDDIEYINNKVQNTSKTIQEYKDQEKNNIIDFSEYVISELNDTEITAIIHMKEVEKMARDVYETLSQIIDSKTFENTLDSKNLHMDIFTQLIDRYSLIDPNINNSEIGLYNDLSLEKMYDDFITKGQESEKDAFEVGIMIEDMLISDLITYKENTDKEDLKQTYSILLEQSKHHMSSFVKDLEKLGYEYSPEYISKTELIDLIKSEDEGLQKEVDNEKIEKEQNQIQQEINSENFVNTIVKVISNFFSIWFK